MRSIVRSIIQLDIKYIYIYIYIRLNIEKIIGYSIAIVTIDRLMGKIQM
jgi:hypothetical protein